jgi:hypothetical protein
MGVQERHHAGLLGEPRGLDFPSNTPTHANVGLPYQITVLREIPAYAAFYSGGVVAPLIYLCTPAADFPFPVMQATSTPNATCHSLNSSATGC